MKEVIMFKIPRVNVIESDEGFSVEIVGRAGLLYTEGDKSLRVDSEVLTGSSGLVVYKKSIRAWAPPRDNEAIGDDKRDTIIENIRRAFCFRGFKIKVI